MRGIMNTVEIQFYNQKSAYRIQITQSHNACRRKLWPRFYFLKRIPRKRDLKKKVLTEKSVYEKKI